MSPRAAARAPTRSLTGKGVVDIHEPTAERDDAVPFESRVLPWGLGDPMGMRLDGNGAVIPPHPCPEVVVPNGGR